MNFRLKTKIGLASTCILGFASAASAQSLSPSTRTRLDAILDTPAVSGARIGLEVRVLGRASSPQQFPSTPLPVGAVTLYERDGAKRFLPASNVKMFTVASALKYLGAGFRVQTRLVGRGQRVGNVWRGDLYLVGGGDPMLATADLKIMARDLARSGIRRVSGRIIGDGSALRAETFSGRFPDSWTLDDTIWYYGAPVSALAIDRNQIDITLTPTQIGALARLTTNTPADFAIVNRARTVAAKTPKSISVERADAKSALSDTLFLSGTLPVASTYTDGVAVPDPPKRAAWILKNALAESGVSVVGAAASGVVSPGAKTELARHASPPLSAMAAFCLKPSDNLSAEMLLRLTALHAGTFPRAATAARAHTMLLSWLRTSSTNVSDASFVDGSGLGRYNMISPRLTADLLAAVEKLPAPESRAFWNALPIAGVDGTLRRRMIGTLGANNARAKTGSFSIASSLSGYVTTRDGFRLAVSFLSNFGPTSAMRDLQNQVFQELAAAELEDAPST